MKLMIDYYEQDYPLDMLVTNQGGCLETQSEVKARIDEYLHGPSNAFFELKCKKATIRLQGIDEVIRAGNLTASNYKK